RRGRGSPRAAGGGCRRSWTRGRRGGAAGGAAGSAAPLSVDHDPGFTHRLRRSYCHTGWMLNPPTRLPTSVNHSWWRTGTHGASAMIFFWMSWYSAIRFVESVSPLAAAASASTSLLQYHDAFAPPWTAVAHDRIGSMKSDGSG